MGRGDHPLARDEGTPAEMVASVQRHLIRDRVAGALVAPDDLIVLLGSNNWQTAHEVYQYLCYSSYKMKKKSPYVHNIPYNTTLIVFLK